MYAVLLYGQIISIILQNIYKERESVWLRECLAVCS